MDNFYTVLPSNTAIEGNKTSNYTVRLPEPLNLDSNWSVALSSIIYPISFTSLGTQEDQFITLKNEIGGEEKIPIPAMNFLSISNLEKGINDAIMAYEKESRTLAKRSILENEGQLRSPERIQETPEIIAAVQEFQRRNAGEGNVTQENTNQSNDLTQAAINLEDQKKLLAAQRAIEKAFNQCVALASQVETWAQLARAKRQKSERLRRKFPDVGQELYNDLLSIANTIQDKAVLIAEETKIAANAKNKVIEFKESQNVREARKVADIAKKAEQNARKLANEAGRLFAGTPERNYQDGVEQITNKIQFLINSVTEPSEKDEGESTMIEQPMPVPQYPSDHPKLQNQGKTEGQAEISINNEREGQTQNNNNEKEGEIQTTNEGELKTQTRIEESPEIIAAVEEFKKRKEEERKRKEGTTESSKPQATATSQQPATVLSQDESGSADATLQKIEEPKEIIDAVNKFRKDKEQEKSTIHLPAAPLFPPKTKVDVPKPQLPVIESSDEEYEWLKPKTTVIKEEKKIEKSSKNNWIISQSTEEIELLPQKKITEYVNKKPEPIRIKGFFIPEETENEEDLSSLPELPKPQALVSASHTDEKGRDLTIPEQVHLSLMNRLKKIGKMAKIPSDPTQRVQFRYDMVYQKFTVLMQKNIKSIQISKQLAYILGFRTNVNIVGGDTAEYMPDLSGGVKQLYIYAPKLIENTMVGDELVPLLRVVNVQGKPGEIVESIYSSEFHHRLQSKRITEISIEVRTSAGELVNFHWGNIILTLHWKRSFF